MSRQSVSLVIPGKNAARTIERCLGAVVPLLESGELEEIVFVDDGSTDDTADRVRAFDARVVPTTGLGPAGARNAGWRATESDFVWFLDADTIAEPDTLRRLVGRLTEASVAGVGGSYLNAEPGSYLAWLIHEEIVARHARIGVGPITHLGSYNVLYRREVLDEVGGFDEVEFPGVAAEDADLSFRIVDAGYELSFEPRSLVAHFHPTRLLGYWRSQAVHGYWGVRLLLRHPQRAENSYNGLTDNLQAPAAVAAAAAAPGLLFAAFRPWVLLAWLALALLTVPFALRILRRTRSARALGYVPFAVGRAFPRGFGMLRGFLSLLGKRSEGG